MKKMFLGAVLLVSTTVMSQQIMKYKEVSELKSRPLSDRDLNAYESKDGYIYRIGEKVRIGTPSKDRYFSYVFTGDGIITPIVAASSVSAGHEAEIKKITISGTKRTGFYISLKMKGMIGFGDGYTVTNFETALASGEIKGSGLTSDEALTELKKAKDKLDLGLITPEDYEKKKAELTPFIK